MSSFNARLRRPKGQVQLMGATLIGAAVFAAVLATQQGWIESFIHEKPKTPSAATERLVQEIDAGEEVILDVADLEHLYDFWLVSETVAGGQVVEALSTTDADWFRERAERTLVVGDGAQRIRALELIRLSGDVALAPVVERALSRYEKIGPNEVIEPCRETLATLNVAAGR